MWKWRCSVGDNNHKSTSIHYSCLEVLVKLINWVQSLEMLLVLPFQPQAWLSSINTSSRISWMKVALCVLLNLLKVSVSYSLVAPVLAWCLQTTFMLLILLKVSVKVTQSHKLTSLWLMLKDYFHVTHSAGSISENYSLVDYFHATYSARSIGKINVTYWLMSVYFHAT